MERIKFEYIKTDSTKGYLYIIDLGDGYYKIGITNDI